MTPENWILVLVIFCLPVFAAIGHWIGLEVYFRFADYREERKRRKDWPEWDRRIREAVKNSHGTQD